ncbi:DUF2207 domain-containing protein [Aequorivita sp. H23M31]|uniref:DUF2207 domain-containing protein n=1 Tax=Aequorivita ciconiae TaxID=2494375 RepID=A0A451FSG4_9FLAO|nr:DUF2207 domain-containing protein [Aequorivita sp. H23M31]QAA80354.1 DUF2207 domain-containing protein [Aequorivita sp. H23M31]
MIKKSIKSPEILFMERIIQIVLFLSVSISGFAQGFVVREFTADIYLNPEGYFDVVEKYDLNFTQAKHGVYRDITTKFDFTDEDGKVTRREIFISNIEVPGEKFTTNEFLGKRLGKNLSIKIGDKEKYVVIDKKYEIRYRVKNALFFTDDFARLYWNIKPADWEAGSGFLSDKFFDPRS